MTHNFAGGTANTLMSTLISSNTHQNQKVRGESGFSLRKMSALAKSGPDSPGTYLVLNGKGAGYIGTTSLGSGGPTERGKEREKRGKGEKRKNHSDGIILRIPRLHSSIKEGHHPFDVATHELARQDQRILSPNILKDFRLDEMKWRIRVLSVAHCEPYTNDERSIAQQYLNLLGTIDIIYHGTFVKPWDARAAESGHLPSLFLAQRARARKFPPEIGLGQNLILPCAT